jgi:hypothetical protein
MRPADDDLKGSHRSPRPSLDSAHGSHWSCHLHAAIWGTRNRGWLERRCSLTEVRERERRGGRVDAVGEVEMRLVWPSGYSGRRASVSMA